MNLVFISPYDCSFSQRICSLSIWVKIVEKHSRYSRWLYSRKDAFFCLKAWFLDSLHKFGLRSIDLRSIAYHISTCTSHTTLLAMITSKSLTASLSRFLEEVLEIPFISHSNQHSMSYKTMYRFFKNIFLLLSLSLNMMTIRSWLNNKINRIKKARSSKPWLWHLSQLWMLLW